MKIKILPLLAGLMVLSSVATSCLDSDNEIVYSDDASITAFSIFGSIETTLIEGKDTTVLSAKGTDYPFTIDQLSRVITNKDSLPYRTNVRKVRINMTTASNYVTYSLKDKDGKDSVCLWSNTDSLDLTAPMVFTVYAPDAINSRLYEVRLNVHQTDPDSLYWTKVDDGSFPGTSMTGNSKAVSFQNRMYVFADAGAQVMVTSSADGSAWTEMTPLAGLEGEADCSTVMVSADKLLLLAGDKVYMSSDALNWQPADRQASALVTSVDDKLVAVHQGRFMEAMWEGNSLNWTETGVEVPAGFPTGNYVSAVLPMPANPSVKQLVLAGTDTTTADSTTVWTGFSTEMAQWTPYVTDMELYNCPKLENLALVHYKGHNVLYVFGGKGVCNNEQLAPFQRFYVSTNYGFVWKPVKNKMGFPHELQGFDKPFAYTVDEKNCLWIMPSGGTSVWKGRMNSMVLQ